MNLFLLPKWIVLFICRSVACKQLVTFVHHQITRLDQIYNIESTIEWVKTSEKIINLNFFYYTIRSSSEIPLPEDEDFDLRPASEIVAVKSKSCNILANRDPIQTRIEKKDQNGDPNDKNYKRERPPLIPAHNQRIKRQKYQHTQDLKLDEACEAQKLNNDSLRFYEENTRSEDDKSYDGLSDRKFEDVGLLEVDEDDSF